MEPFVHKIFTSKGKTRSKKIWLNKKGFTLQEPLDQAVFAYPIKHYTYISDEEIQDMEVGEKGENFSMLEVDEFTVSIGDTYKLGEAIIQVSQPGKATTKHLEDRNFQTGWFFRVLEEGYVKSETDLELIERPYPQWTIAACNEIMYVNKHDLRLADELYECELLGEQWRRVLRKRARGF